MNQIVSRFLRSAGIIDSNVPFIWIIIAVCIMPLFLGLTAVMAEPVPVALAAALLSGLALLARPLWMIWLILLIGLLVAGVASIWLEGVAIKAAWGGIAAIGFALLGITFTQALTRSGATKSTPSFVWLTLAFMLYGVFNTLLNWPTAYEAFSGFKRYFQVTSLLFALAWLPVTEEEVARWRRLFLVVAIFQLPWAIYERFKLVPIRESLMHAYPGMVPIDVVAGTFGAEMTSGASNAEMATFLIIIVLFLLARMRERLLSKGQVLRLIPLILIPLFLGETKVVVVLLPLAFTTLYRRDLLTRPSMALAGLILGSLLTTAAGYTYVEITKKSWDVLAEETFKYNVAEKGYGSLALNRTSVFSFWAKHQGLDDPASAIMGHGLGTAHDATGGEIARRYPGYGISLTAASSLLWEQGLLGSTLFLAIFAFAWRAAGQIQHNNASSPWVRADAAAIQAALPCFAFYLIYRSALIEIMSFQIVFWGLLGYLAWLLKVSARASHHEL